MYPKPLVVRKATFFLFFINDCLNRKTMYIFICLADPAVTGCPGKNNVHKLIKSFVRSSPFSFLLFLRGGNCHLAFVVRAVDLIRPSLKERPLQECS